MLLYRQTEVVPNVLRTWCVYLVRAAARWTLFLAVQRVMRSQHKRIGMRVPFARQNMQVRTCVFQLLRPDTIAWSAARWFMDSPQVRRTLLAWIIGVATVWCRLYRWAVSYTHLDVYKRQISGSINTSTQRRSVSTDVFYAENEHKGISKKGAVGQSE